LSRQKRVCFIGYIFSFLFLSLSSSPTIISTPYLRAQTSAALFDHQNKVQIFRPPNAKDACISSKNHTPSMYKNQIRRPAPVNSRQYVHQSSSLPAAASRGRSRRRGSSWFLLVSIISARNGRKREEGNVQHSSITDMSNLLSPVGLRGFLCDG
jgi:hypothetical protein